MTATTASLPFEVGEGQSHLSHQPARAAAAATHPLVGAYRARNGRVVSASLARQLLPAAQGPAASRITQNQSAAAESRQLSLFVWRDVLDELAAEGEEDSTVLIVVAPTGSGKRALARDLDAGIVAGAKAVLFTTFVDATFVYQRIEEALAVSASTQVVVIYLHRGIELATAEALALAAETLEVTSLEELAREHADGPGHIGIIHRRYLHNRRVHVAAVHAAGQLKDVHPASVPSVEREQQSFERNLRRAREAFAHDYSQRRWPDREEHDALFTAFTSLAAPGAARKVDAPGRGELRQDARPLDTRPLEIPRGRNDPRRPVAPARTDAARARDDDDDRTPPYRGRARGGGGRSR